MVPKVCLITIFLKQSNFLFFYAIVVLNLIKQFLPKTYMIIPLAKKFNCSVDLIFEICFDSKLSVREKRSLIIKNFIYHFESFNHYRLLFFLVKKLILISLISPNNYNLLLCFSFLSLLIVYSPILCLNIGAEA